MNYLNLLLAFLIAVYVLNGLHKGFLMSVSNTIGLICSWFIGFLFCEPLAATISRGSFYRFVLIFTEGSSHLADQVQGHLAVSELSHGEIVSIVDSASLPEPFGHLLLSNMENQVYSGSYQSVADYFDYTVTDTVVNIISFLLVYLASRIIISLILNTMYYASPFPMLKHLDAVAGGAVGLLRGCLGMYAICMVIPILLISMPANITLFSDIIDGSSLATTFYHSDFLLQFIPGVIK
ncbi:MAG: CvpA family protein [Clostridia bacterium]|nr:CvpA family protein [Clostridia bacterium]